MLTTNLLTDPLAKAYVVITYLQYNIHSMTGHWLFACLQERLTDILEFYANYKQAEKRPATCFWPVAAPAVTAASTPNPPASNATAGSASATKAAAACSLSAAAVAKPADFYHSRDASLEVSSISLLMVVCWRGL
jgi:hypothetical protein